MALYFRAMSCCGLQEITGISYTPIPDVVTYVSNYKHVRWAHLLFTQATRAKVTPKNPYGSRLAAYIKEHKLGTVTRVAAARRNPNTGNLILAWIWTPDWNALETHVAHLQTVNDRLNS